MISYIFNCTFKSLLKTENLLTALKDEDGEFSAFYVHLPDVIIFISWPSSEVDRPDLNEVQTEKAFKPHPCELYLW